MFQSILLDREGYPEYALDEVFTATTYDLVDSRNPRDWWT